jgi:hypothetical protein
MKPVTQCLSINVYNNLLQGNVTFRNTVVSRYFNLIFNEETKLKQFALDKWSTVRKKGYSRPHIG